ncbi:myosin heavy chain [Kwoniella mangroviensis CBS 10435]|uniref:Myosin heavy chain n=1 Tax=Kwoniella mangroviensis CBS 10435 TaxID=1331196 RepID=A0A1B9IQS6_9TREE|nr:myosin heavy chain [Kwoniella mangroviensis CBS 10435]
MDRLVSFTRRTTPRPPIYPYDAPPSSSHRRMWLPDPIEGFLPCWIRSQSGDDSSPDATAEVQISTTNELRTVPLYQLSPMNPPQFDGVEDIADLTHLNEASVINNLRTRYESNNIYTYSGLFLISLNPYQPLPIYTSKHIAQYRTRRREENAPHIFAVAERAWQQIGEERESQSILITGESGAGKTENTKKVIQYLAAIAASQIPSDPSSSSSSSLTRSKSVSKAPSTGLPRSSSFKGKDASEIDLSSLAITEPSLGLLEQQILQANPILEAFGNAQTMRNNNSSRFGKFIRIFFSPSGAIAGANIDWYLLEKSRVTARAEGERNFHVFYQLLKGAKEAKLADRLLLDGGPEKFEFLKKTRFQIDGVNDHTEWRLLKEALAVVGFTETEQFELFRIPAVILHIGNLLLTGSATDQAFLPPAMQPVADRICHLLGISVKEFTKSVLQPKVRAGREWVTNARTKKQAEDELAALCKFMYEKTFGWMVERINTALDRPSAKSLSIGVLDIAGFEIFVENSYEQLLINFTNEKLQQFFNFHMFTLEQEEYAREGIEWDYVNFGLDLQPTIELIESTQPIGMLSLLDEECIMPRATDLTFTEKVQQLWETPKGASPKHPGSSKFKATRFGAGFVIKHYAGDVEYRTQGWLEKNKDPINEAVARLLATSEIPSIAALFSEYAEDAATVGVVKKVKRGAFRTVGQRHKEQLGQLMQQLSSTQPHFVRCIVPNSDKQPGKVNVNLVLDQLRCNGVLEGIRIARLGYPNRHSFAEFRQRYEVLTPGVIPKGYMDGRKAAERIAEALELDKQFYKIGATKIFFKAGVLAELEERRDNLLTDLFRRFQSAARMHVARRRILKLINRAQAVRTIQRNARVYLQLKDWPWWGLYVKVRPLLAATRTDDELVRKQAELAMAKERAERDEMEKKKLEELKASLVAEKTKVEGDLSSERELGREKDRMLERSKAREAELEEKIKELEGDIDLLDSEREKASTQADLAKEKLSKVQADFEALVEQAAMLEKQGSIWQKREAELLKDSKERSNVYSRLEKEKVELQNKVEDLKREVTQKEEALKRAKDRAEANSMEMEKRLQLEKSKAESGNSQATALNEDLRRAKSQMDELQSTIQRHTTSIEAKQRELSELKTKQRESDKARETSEQALAALNVKVESMKSQIAAKDKEKQAEVSARQKLEKELDDLRKVMAAKSSEDSKRQEADKSREQEMSSLRDQVSQLQKSLDDQREAAQQLANKLRVDVEGLNNSHTNAQRELKLAQNTLKEKEEKLAAMQVKINQVEEQRRKDEKELEMVREQLSGTESRLHSTAQARDDIEKHLHALQDEYNGLEDAVLEIEGEKANWAKSLDNVTRQLHEESSKRHHFEQEVHNNQVELAEHRNTALQAERALAKAAADIKARDKEIDFLRGRENKTVVEHYHVLEKAKKFTDQQLAEQIKENDRLNTLLKSLETHRNRLNADLEDLARQYDKLKASKSKEARSARASLSPEDKDLTQLLEEEKKARRVLESRINSLEKDLQDQRKQASTASLSASSSRGLEVKYRQSQDNLSRLEIEHQNTLEQNQRLQNQINELQKALSTASSRPLPTPAPSTPSNSNLRREDLLRGLQQSHDALRGDMSDQLRRLNEASATPLTPSKRQSVINSNGTPTHSQSLAGQDLISGKKIKALEMEVDALKRQLEDEQDEKDFLIEQMDKLQSESGITPGKDGKLFPYEQAVYSHFRLKAKSLRSQLDHWLAMEDLNNSTPGSNLTPSVSASAPRTEDVVQLKHLLQQFDPETSPLRHS